MHKLTSEEKNEIYTSFLSANYFWVLVSIGIGILSHISRAMRWKLMLKPMGYFPSLKNTFLAVMIGYFANLALPRLGEVSRCGILAKYEKIPFQKSFGTVVTERAVDMIMLLIVFLLTFIVHIDKFSLFKNTTIVQNLIAKYNQLENPGSVYYIGIAIIVLLAFIFYKLRHKISHLKLYIKLKEIFFGFIEGIKSLAKMDKPYLFVFHSIFIWTMYWLMNWIVVLAIPETSHLGLDVGLAILAFGSIGIIVVQGGIGIYPWIVAEILLLYNVPETKGYAFGWLNWTGQTFMIVFVGLLALIFLPIVNQKKNEPSSELPKENI